MSSHGKIGDADGMNQYLRGKGFGAKIEPSTDQTVDRSSAQHEAEHGKPIQMGKAALPKSIDGAKVDAELYNAKHQGQFVGNAPGFGFTPNSSITGADGATLTAHVNAKTGMMVVSRQAPGEGMSYTEPVNVGRDWATARK
jgi:hypothetical protein